MRKEIRKRIQNVKNVESKKDALLKYPSPNVNREMKSVVSSRNVQKNVPSERILTVKSVQLTKAVLKRSLVQLVTRNVALKKNALGSVPKVKKIQPVKNAQLKKVAQRMKSHATMGTPSAA